MGDRPSIGITAPSSAERLAGRVTASRVSDARRYDTSCKGSLLVGVLSDTHGRLDSDIVDVFAGVDHIIHAGDVGDRDILETLAVLAPVTAVRGNSDEDGWVDLPEAVTAAFGDLTLHVRHDLAMVELLDAPVLAAMQRSAHGMIISGHTPTPTCRPPSNGTASTTSTLAPPARRATMRRARLLSFTSRALHARPRFMCSGAICCTEAGGDSA